MPSALGVAFRPEQEGSLVARDTHGAGISDGGKKHQPTPLRGRDWYVAGLFFECKCSERLQSKHFFDLEDGLTSI